jgi:hypothetical protein
MFDQIPDGENEIMGAFRESNQERGILSTLISGVGLVILGCMVVCLIAIVNGWGMTDADGAKRVLTESGYSSISITGYRWFTCDKHDYFHTGFDAVGPTGQHVTGTVCKGMVFKSSTVRLD